jgi:MraZ protein
VPLGTFRGSAVLVAPFVSTTVNKLDAKGRVSVPAPFRQILASQNTSGLYCIRSFVTPSLDGFGQALIDSFAARLDTLDPLFSETHDAQAQVVFGGSMLLNFDDEGRVRLPDAFIAHAGITERVTFVGLGRKFEMWDPARFEPVEAARVKLARATRMGSDS